MLAGKTKSKYMAGLWEDDLHGLAWFKDGPDEVISPATESQDEAGYLAPSWSWVSMNESITYRFNEEERVISVKDPILVHTDIRNRDPDPFGRVSGGSITVEALVKTFQCVTISEVQRVFGYVEPKQWANETFEALPIHIYAENGTHVGTGCFDGPFERDVLHTCKAIRIAERSYERTPYWTDDEENVAKPWGPIKQSVIYFLLVQPDEENKGAWKRVGAGMTRNMALRQHYQDPFDLWEWEELRLF